VKKIVLAAVIVIVAASLFLAFGAKSRTRTVRAREWPMGLGRLDSVPARYPKGERTPAAIELEELAAKTVQPGVPDPVANYVRAQLQRLDRRIDPAPPIHANVPAIRSLLLSGRPIAWRVDMTRGANAPIPSLNVLMRISRLLTASALERARLGDAGAWDDLRAQRALSRGLWQRPEFISALIAMAIDRNVIAAARKMPLPAPAWFDELRTFDHRKAMLAAMQADTWLISSSIKEYFASRGEGRNGLEALFDQTVDQSYGELSRAELAARQREIASQLAELTTCALDFPDPSVPWWNEPAQSLMPNIIATWHRVFRLRAEIELTEHALGLRSGPQSQCSDGHWIVTPSSVKFSKPIPLAAPKDSVIPLEIRR
jgi:hypothetical protein